MDNLLLALFIQHKDLDSLAQMGEVCLSKLRYSSKWTPRSLGEQVERDVLGEQVEREVLREQVEREVLGEQV